MNHRLVALISGWIWKTRPIDEQPEMQLTRWSIWEVGAGSSATRHLVGYNLIDHEGRVSSAIVEFDAVALRGQTKSGRVYELIGPPGHCVDGDYVFARWLHLNDDPENREVTFEIVSLMSEANQ